jgi:hypothetical protein
LWAAGFLQATEAVQDVLLGRFARFQGFGDSSFNLLLIMEQYQGQDIHHLPITAGTHQQAYAQLPEAIYLAVS